MIVVVKFALWAICSVWALYQAQNTLSFHGREPNERKRFFWACSVWCWIGILVMSIVKMICLLRG